MSKRSGSVHVATTTRNYKGKVYQTHLLRRSFRKDGKVLHETLGNISHLPLDLIELIRQRLRGEIPIQDSGLHILRSLPHGHVAAVLGTLRQIGLDKIISSTPSKERDLVIAMIIDRIIDPLSKLATWRGLAPETASSSLALELGLEPKSERDLYLALDWLHARQNRIENKLAKKHLKEGSLILYDLSGSYYTGRHCRLAQYGYNRDCKKGFPQIVYGLLCNNEGCPVAIEVFAGNTADPKTLQSQVDKIRKRFQLKHVVLVGDRGMITSKRIEECLSKIDGLDWITALRADTIKNLAQQGVIQWSLFDKRDLAEVTSPDFPGERLIICRNPFLAEERARKRQELLTATEAELTKIVAATQRAKRPLRGKEHIGIRLGKVLSRSKMGKHFQFTIEDTRFGFQRDEEKIAAEAHLDGLYVLRTSVTKDDLNATQVVRAYKDLAKVERAFRCLKMTDLKIRPIYHRLDDRVRAHVLLCMLAYYLEWHLRQRLTEFLFEEEDPSAADALRESIVAPAQRSPRTMKKEQTKRTAGGLPVHSFQTLLRDLATLVKNRVRASSADQEFYLLTQQTPYQREVFKALELTL